MKDKSEILLNYEIVQSNDTWIVTEKSSNYGRNLNERLFEFAVRIVKFLRSISDSPENRIIKNQLIKSATSMGANYEEAQGSNSKKDFSNKCAIVFKEARETNYWLRLLQATSAENNKELSFLIEESDELKKIFASIIIKTRPREFWFIFYQLSFILKKQLFIR